MVGALIRGFRVLLVAAAVALLARWELLLVLGLLMPCLAWALRNERGRASPDKLGAALALLGLAMAAAGAVAGVALRTGEPLLLVPWGAGLMILGLVLRVLSDRL